MICPAKASCTRRRFGFANTPRSARVDSSIRCRSEITRRGSQSFALFGRTREDARGEGRLVCGIPRSCGQTSEKESQVSEEREYKPWHTATEESGEDDKDVEAHHKKHKFEADPTASDESDDVEAHVKKHKVD